MKVSWGNHCDEEATWKEEDDVRRAYPELFQGMQLSGKKVSKEGRVCNA